MTAAAEMSISVTKAALYRRCVVKWHYQYIQLIPVPSSASQQLGTDVHNVAEEYCKTGKPPHEAKAGRIFASAMPYAPTPGTGHTEEWIGLPIIPGAKLKGKIDWYCWEDEVEVLDWKTLKDFKWAKTEWDLREDLQLLIYAYAVVMLRRPDRIPAKVRVSHVQMRTTGMPISNKVHSDVPWHKIEAAWRDFQQTAREMLALASVKPHDIVVKDSRRANPSACSDYGGCPFQDRCPWSPQNMQEGVIGAAVEHLAAGKKTMGQTEEARRQLLFGDDTPTPPSKPSASTQAPTNAPSPGARPTQPVNPPDASAGSHQTTPMFDEAAAALKNVLEVAPVVKGEWFAKTLTKYGITPENGPEVLKRAGAKMNHDGTIEMGVATPADKPMEVAGPQVRTEEVMDDVHMVFVDDTRVNKPDGKAMTFPTANAAIMHVAALLRAELAAKTKAEAAAIPTPPPPPKAEPAETPAHSGPKKVAHSGPKKVAKIPAPTDIKDLDVAGWDKLDGVTQTGILALHTALKITSPLDEDASAKVIKEACNIKSLRAVLRDGMFDAGVALALFTRNEDDSIVLVPDGWREDDVVVEAPEPAKPAEPTKMPPRDDEGAPVAKAAAPKADRTPAPVPVGDQPAAFGLVILVDAFPSAGVTWSLEQWLAPLEDQVAQANNVTVFTEVDFGKGGPQVAARLVVKLANDGVPQGWATLSSRYPAAENVLAVLRRAGALIIRGAH